MAAIEIQSVAMAFDIVEGLIEVDVEISKLQLWILKTRFDFSLSYLKFLEVMNSA